MRARSALKRVVVRVGTSRARRISTRAAERAARCRARCDDLAERARPRRRGPRRRARSRSRRPPRAHGGARAGTPRASSACAPAPPTANVSSGGRPSSSLGSAPRKCASSSGLERRNSPAGSSRTSRAARFRSSVASDGPPAEELVGQREAGEGDPLLGHAVGAEPARGAPRRDEVVDARAARLEPAPRSGSGPCRSTTQKIRSSPAAIGDDRGRVERREERRARAAQLRDEALGRGPRRDEPVERDGRRASGAERSRYGWSRGMSVSRVERAPERCARRTAPARGARSHS